MKPVWLIGHLGDDEETEALKRSVKLAGMTAKVVDKESYWLGTYENIFKEVPVIFHGALFLAQRFKRSNLARGVFWDNVRYNCSYYYSMFDSFLLNKKYYILSLRHLLGRMDAAYEYYASKNSLFIKTDSGNKPFAGRVVQRLDFKLFYERHINHLDPETMVIVAPPQEIIEEYRFVIADKKVITGCQYMLNGKFAKCDKIRWDALCFAQDVAKTTKYAPARAWVMDVCVTKDGNISVLEVNSFSCSSLYDCNYDEIVDIVSQIVVDEYKRDMA